MLTETVWALAHQKDPVVPDEIFVITTKKGKADLKSALLSGKTNVWEQLKSALRKEKVAIDGKLVFTEHLVKVMLANGEEMEDLRTGDENLLAADCMLRELRKYTEEPGTTVLCSIAGGRKTMSALLFSCMSLLGREQDKVYHVLIPPEYECGMDPPFFFPQKGVSHQPLFRGKLAGKKVPSSKIAIELFEVPFVRIRGWFQEKFKTPAPSYKTLVSRMQTIAPPAVAYPEIEIDAWDKGVTVNGAPVSLSNPCFAMLVLLAGGCESKELHERLIALHSAEGVAKCDWLASFQEGSRFVSNECPEDVSKVQSELRKKLKEAGFANVESLVPQRGSSVMFPVKRVKWRNRAKLADICGNLIKMNCDESVIS